MKRAGLLAALLVCALLLPLMFVGALLSVAGDQPAASDKALAEIPEEMISIYQAAADTCPGLEWTVLAAIHKLETHFGVGRATSSKGAQGPMQFMPPTFVAYAVDGDGDGITDINNVSDAIFSAARLLCANGGGEPARLASAIWNFNHSQAYLNEVVSLASSYGVFQVPDGVAFAAPTDLLRNRRVILTPQARADLEAGVIDPRLVSLLSWISERHTIGVTVFMTGHSKYTRSGSVSNHYYGRAADIFFVNGQPVSSSSEAARRLVMQLSDIRGPLRPHEIGHPFRVIGFPGGFSDNDHADHFHVGYDM